MTMWRYALFLVFLFSCQLWSQNEQDSLKLIPDQDYLEDQFYIGLNYNLLRDKPADVSQRNFSYGLMIGAIKDLPLNYDRTLALGVGLGYGFNSYYSDLRAIETGDDIRYEVLDGSIDVKRNKVETHLVELPIELRWRNSGPVSHKFWRVYGGVRFAYVVGGRSKLVAEDFTDSFYNEDLQKLRYGVQLNLGYNTFNVHLYYALNGLFQDGEAQLEGEAINIRPFRFGLIFYIL